jgi:hypothetical protein
MSFITQAVENATYNEAAAKKREEQQTRAQQERLGLQTYLNDVSVEIQKGVNQGQITAASGKAALDLVKQTQNFLNSNPNAEPSTLSQKRQEVVSKISNLDQAQPTVKKIEEMIENLPKRVDDLIARGILPSSAKKGSQKVLTDLQKWSEQNRFATKGEWELKYQVAQKDLNESVPEESQLAELEAKKKVEDETFSTSRLFKTIGEWTGKVVGSLFYIALCLVAGSLAANDAIGRDRMYRVFYFVYGFIFAPFVLVYYIFRWFKGTSPYLYKLLPLITTPAETSLGRFFLFPFTYDPDPRSKKETFDFLKSLAETVGKQAPKEAEKLESPLEKLGSLRKLLGAS